jgi:hypothetical protein
MLAHAKVIGLIRPFLLINQRHWTHPLCWPMQRWLDWSEHSSWWFRGTELTFYVGPCKGDWNIPSAKSEELTIYVGPCKDDWTDQNIPPDKSEALDSLSMLAHAKVIGLIRTFLLINQRHWTHLLVGPCKGDWTDQNIPPDKSETLDSPSMLKMIGLIRTFLLIN